MYKKLKPCPFCGGTDIESFQTKADWQDYTIWHIGCPDCGAWFETANWTEEEAVEAWNSRRELEDRTERWNRLMLYLADLQLEYSTRWGANGCGDEKLYEFVTGLIEELERWENDGTDNTEEV